MGREGAAAASERDVSLSEDSDGEEAAPSKGRGAVTRGTGSRLRVGATGSAFATFRQTVDSISEYPPSWSDFLLSQREEMAWVASKIEERLDDESRLSPRPSEIFAPFHQTPLNENLRVLLFYDGPSVDWDPATGEPHALGYALGHRMPKTYAPLKLLAEGACAYRSRLHPGKTFDPERDFDYTLRNWARQGVLLLNVTPFRKRTRKQNPKHVDDTFQKLFSGFYNNLLIYLSNMEETGFAGSSCGEVPSGIDLVVATFRGSAAHTLFGCAAIRAFGDPVFGPNINDPSTKLESVVNMFAAINQELKERDRPPVEF